MENVTGPFKMKRYTSCTEPVFDKETKEKETLSDIDFLKRHFDKDKPKNGYCDDKPLPGNVLARLLSDSMANDNRLQRTNINNNIDKPIESSHSKTLDCNQCNSHQCTHLTENSLKSVVYELSELKQRDRSLLRQFIEIRKTIHELSQERQLNQSRIPYTRSLFNMADFPSMVSLDEEPLDQERNTLLKGDEYLGEYRQRTVSVSIVQHGSAPVVRKRFIYGDI